MSGTEFAKEKENVAAIMRAKQQAGKYAGGSPSMRGAMRMLMSS